MSSPTRTENPATLAERASKPHSAPPKPNETSKKKVTGLLGIGKTGVKATPASCPPSPHDRSRKTAVSPSKFPVFLSRDRAPQPQTPPLCHTSRRPGDRNHGLASNPRHMKIRPHNTDTRPRPTKRLCISTPARTAHAWRDPCRTRCKPRPLPPPREAGESSPLFLRKSDLRTPGCRTRGCR